MVVLAGLCQTGTYPERVACFQKEQRLASERAKKSEIWWDEYYRKHNIAKNFEDVPQYAKKNPQRRKLKRQWGKRKKR